MRILDSQVNFRSAHELAISSDAVNTKSLQTTSPTEIDPTQRAIGETLTLNASFDTERYSEHGHSLYTRSSITDAVDPNTTQPQPTVITQEQFTESVVHALTGTEVTLSAMSFSPNQLTPDSFVQEIDQQFGEDAVLQPSDLGQTPDPGQAQISTIEIQERSIYQEQEHSFMAANGLVTTADGRAIDFSLELGLDRFYSEETNLDLLASSEVLYDPLVISLDGSPATLTNSTFLFDIDSDGVEDTISELNIGVGYLAFDKNGDDKINDGSELFGTQSGNGFADLALHDADGNGWLDENDPLFAKLVVWQRDSDGNDSLTSLKNAGVGAIYLGSTTTEFSLTNDTNDLLGKVRRSGVYLKESGEVMSVQQIDLAIQTDSLDSQPSSVQNTTIENKLNDLQKTFDDLNSLPMNFRSLTPISIDGSGATMINSPLSSGSPVPAPLVNFTVINLKVSAFSLESERAIQTYQQTADQQFSDQNIADQHNSDQQQGPTTAIQNETETEFSPLKKQILDRLFKQLDIKNPFENNFASLETYLQHTKASAMIQELLEQG
ncbi:MAG: hypothetical protein KUG82_21535 [Pseudomonadales bacterium]|nr:hypothetical protein [Pseudomonadales bacterium]